MEAAVDDDVLNTSAYFRLLVGQRGSVVELTDYPAGRMLAMLEGSLEVGIGDLGRLAGRGSSWRP